jgi:acyl carrier protein
MSWMDRVKNSFGGAASAAASAGMSESTSEAIVSPIRAPSGDVPHDEIIAHLRSRLVFLAEGKLRADEVDPTAHLFDYGYIDSLSAVTFLTEIEQSYGVRIEDVEILDQFGTLDAIVRRIRSAR